MVLNASSWRVAITVEKRDGNCVVEGYSNNIRMFRK